MEIALLTIWHERNYGAEMQTYATVKMLQSMGHTVHVIDYRLSGENYRSFKGKVASYISCFSVEMRKFGYFWRTFIPSTRHYRTLAELEANPPQADVYIVGSDQVWNPDITRNAALAYFLPFGDDRIKRISYASSFGTNAWNGNHQLTAKVAGLLKRFSAISCRELTGAKILADAFGIDTAATVLDPTLLHCSYPELTGDIEPKHTLAYYPLSSYTELEQFSRNLAREMGLEFKNINESRYLIKRVVWDRPGVEDWVKSIAEAEFVVTPSFHGLAFSLIYRKPFIIVSKSDTISRNSRITDLLGDLGLSSRYFHSIEEARRSKAWLQPIDYDAVTKRLDVLRENSISYLKTALS